MDGQALTVLAVAFSAALASTAGGVIAIYLRAGSFLLSMAVGFAAGVLLGTFAFEMVPKALEQSSLVTTVGGFALGFALVYGLDLLVNRGRMAGGEADQIGFVRSFHRRHKPHGSQVTVLAGATSAEELIEGITIGVGAAIDPSVAFIVGAAIFIDNISEALSIGELVRKETEKGYKWRILKWTNIIALSLFVSAMVGWFALRGLPPGLLGFLLAIGAGGMFYLTVTDMVPEAEDHHYQESSAIAICAGFLTILILSELM